MICSETNPDTLTDEWPSDCNVTSPGDTSNAGAFELLCDKATCTVGDMSKQIGLKTIMNVRVYGLWPKKARSDCHHQPQAEYNKPLQGAWLMFL